MKLNLGLLSLAIGAFGIGVTEFAAMSILPDFAAGLGVHAALVVVVCVPPAVIDDLQPARG